MRLLMLLLSEQSFEQIERVDRPRALIHHGQAVREVNDRERMHKSGTFATGGRQAFPGGLVRRYPVPAFGEHPLPARFGHLISTAIREARSRH